MCFYKNFIMPKQAVKQHFIGSAFCLTLTAFGTIYMIKNPNPYKNNGNIRFVIRY